MRVGFFLPSPRPPPPTLFRPVARLCADEYSEGWNEIMSDYEIREPACVLGSTFFDSDCGSQVYANALFVSWNILSMYIFVSMVSAYSSFSFVFCPAVVWMLTTTYSSSLLFSRVSAMSTSDRGIHRKFRGKRSENSSRHGPSLTRTARGTFRRTSSQGFWVYVLASHCVFLDTQSNGSINIATFGYLRYEDI